ncbi:MAG: TonB-dependent receptor plug domain-containing protein, partial [Pseudomonadota bacterium]
PIVLSGGLTPIDAESYGRAYSIVTREELEARQIVRVSDALRALPGVSVTRTGAPGGVARVRLRGAEENHTLVLIDGVEAASTGDGAYNFAGLLAADVERIEVLRGPQSALYGANALGGVVSITTRGAERQGLMVGGSVEAGTEPSGSAHLYMRGRDKRGAFSLSVARRESAGFDARPDVPGDDADGERNLTVNAKAEVFASDALTLGGQFRLTDRFAEFDDSFSADPGQDSTEMLAGLHARFERGRFRHEARASMMSVDDRFLPGSFEQESERAEVSLRSTVALDAPELAEADHLVTLLAEHARESYETPSIDNSRALSGFAAEYRGVFLESVSLQASARHELNDRFEDATTWSLAVAWTPEGTGTRLHASAGEAVVNPTFIEQFGFGTIYVGNPDLEPEESLGWDAGVEQTFWDGRAVVDVTYFRQNLENEIVSSFAGPPSNIEGESERQGVEVTAELRPMERLTLGLDYTWLEASGGDGLAEIRRPEHQARGSATLGFGGGRGQVTVSGRYVAGATDLSGGDRVKLEDHFVADVAASWRVSDRVEVFGRVENAFDADYQEVEGYATRGMTAFAGLRASF